MNVGSLPVGLSVLPNSYYGFTAQLTNASATTVVYPAAVSPPTDGQVAMLVQRNVGGVITTQQVSMGAVNSGGAGFRLLRVPSSLDEHQGEMYGKHRGKDVVDDRLVFHLNKQPCQRIRADLVLKVALLGISPRISLGIVNRRSIR